MDMLYRFGNPCFVLLATVLFNLHRLGMGKLYTVAILILPVMHYVL